MDRARVVHVMRAAFAAWSACLLLAGCGAGSSGPHAATSTDAGAGGDAQPVRADASAQAGQEAGPMADAGPDVASDAAAAASLVVTPSSAHVGPGGSLAFFAALAGGANVTVAWTVEARAPPAGPITSTGLLAPRRPPRARTTSSPMSTSPAVTASATVTVASVAACDAPPAGSWDAKSISPVVAAMPSNASSHTGQSCAIIVDPFDGTTVWLGTGYEGLFKSTDCGATWKHVNTPGDLVDQGASSGAW